MLDTASESALIQQPERIGKEQPTHGWESGGPVFPTTRGARALRSVIYSNDIMSALGRENLILEPENIKAIIP